MRAEMRWLLVALAAAILLIAAIWPRGDDSELASSLPTGASHGTSTSEVDEAELAQLAAAAALRPCPEAPPDGALPGDLTGVTAPCLGSTTKIDIGSALSGEPTLINLWASWCAPCRQEIPVLEAYANEPGAVRVVGVNVQDKQTNALALLTELNAHYPSFGDADAVQKALPAPPVLPLSFLVQRDGTVERITSTPVFHDPAQVREAIGSLVR
ncbi:thiol-disulfide oxidoreductase (plasmid) [Rhodococcus oxybenzonivorans]|uniref:Thiol-disulfide oxidoreductase n=1 Tax=Rhodococcus oxybenzonivorans TaxID=1990687 RepID=A0A2S2C7E3_9NOCA|nr:TlpA disulfide reductase family protein [Rhodococcus oxybenzonivorans]AWK76797.1 thiol-disulfide oxidoreductase [Rhodococcus oxybenzonivorans]